MNALSEALQADLIARPDGPAQISSFFMRRL